MTPAMLAERIRAALSMAPADPTERGEYPWDRRPLMDLVLDRSNLRVILAALEREAYPLLVAQFDDATGALEALTTVRDLEDAAVEEALRIAVEPDLERGEVRPLG